jgi:hypothetical protein
MAISIERESITPECALVPADQEWLSAFGVDASWQDDEAVQDELRKVIATGSRHLHSSSAEDLKAETYAARERFLEFSGISPETIAAVRARSPALIPLDTFIATQREMSALGLNAPSLIRTSPGTVCLAPESVRRKVENLDDLGVDGAAAINILPSVLGLAPESVQRKVAEFAALGIKVPRALNDYPVLLGGNPKDFKARMEHLRQQGFDVSRIVKTAPIVLSYEPERLKAKVANLRRLNLDPIKIVKSYPTVFSLAPESVAAKVANLSDLGLDAVRLVNAAPSLIGLAPKSVAAKVENLSNLGLDAPKIIQAFPKILTLAPESVAAKLTNLKALGLRVASVVNAAPTTLSMSEETICQKFQALEQVTTNLRWSYGAHELVDTYPAILGFNPKKLKVLERIAANHLTTDSRFVKPGEARSALITPLEQYILALARDVSSMTVPISLEELEKQARACRLDKLDRRHKALEIAASGKLGRIGTMYLDYRGETAT